MRRNVLCGVGLAVLAGLVVTLSGTLSLHSVWPMLLGAAVVLVPGGRLPARLIGFAVGLVAAWLGFALRAAVLPDITTGRAIAIGVTVLVVTAVAAGTAGRVPLWAGLAGLAAFSGAYDPVYTAAPTAFVAQSVATFTSVLLASALGALAGTLLTPLAVVDERRRVNAAADVPPMTVDEQGV